MGKESIDTTRTILILISGKAGVGKSTLAKLLLEYLVERYDGIKVKVAPFAQGVKSIAARLGWNGQKDAKGRALLQGIGLVGRDYNPDVWVNATFSAIENHQDYPFHVVIVDDWRFPNELDVANKFILYEPVTVRVEASTREALLGTPEYNDVSEMSLPSAKTIPYYNFVVDNSTSMEALDLRAKELWEFILNSKTEIFIWN